MLAGNVEEKVESKAAHRAGQPNKIKGEATFAEGAHGTLKFKVENKIEKIQHFMMTSTRYTNI